MTLVLDNLEKAGLVRRERSLEDRRMVRIFLTEAGQALIEEVLPAHVNAIFTELCVLTADEQQTLGKLCRKLGLPAQEDRGSCLNLVVEEGVE
jgi:MarR family 2-MHQ and catechol resistance regulon transcriptional repressor